MKCEIIRDLMPSYIDGMTSKESNLEIENHLEGCEECRDYRDSMKKAVASETYVGKSADEIKPFKKVKMALTMRMVILIVFIIAFIWSIIYGQYESRYLNGRDADIEDVVIEYQDFSLTGTAKHVTLTYKPAKDDMIVFAAYGEGPQDSAGNVLEESDENATYMGVIKQRVSPFHKDVIRQDTEEYWFIDEETMFDPITKEEVKLTGEEKLIIEFAGGEKKEISFRSLYTGEGLEGVEVIR